MNEFLVSREEPTWIRFFEMINTNTQNEKERKIKREKLYKASQTQEA